MKAFDVGERSNAELRAIFVARGRLLGASQIEYEVHRIT
jgi:hypothetical protein